MYMDQNSKHKLLIISKWSEKTKTAYNTAQKQYAAQNTSQPGN